MSATVSVDLVAVDLLNQFEREEDRFFVQSFRLLLGEALEEAGVLGACFGMSFLELLGRGRADSGSAVLRSRCGLMRNRWNGRSGFQIACCFFVHADLIY